MGGNLDPRQQQDYQDEGVLFPLSAVEASAACAACEQALAFLECLGPEARTVESSQVHLFLPWAFDLVTDSRVLDAVEGIGNFLQPHYAPRVSFQIFVTPARSDG